MIIKIIGYLSVLIYSLIYTINNYSNPFQIIGNTILISGILGLILYHFDLNFKNKKGIWIAIILSLFCSYVTFGQLTYSYKKETIKVQNISDSVITIDAIYLDGNKQKINHDYDSSYDHFNSANKRTAYQQYNKNDDRYKATLFENDTYNFKTKKSKNVKIEFQRSNIPYNVYINDQKFKVKPLSKTFNQKANMIYNSNFIFEYDNLNKAVPIWKIVLILFISIILYFNIWNRILGHDRGILLLLPVLLIEINPFINIDFITKFIGLVIYTWFILKFNQKGEIKKKSHKILVAIGSIYISFSFVGHKLIEDRLNIKFFLIFLLFCWWIYQLFPLILNFIDKTKSKKLKKEKRNKNFHILLLFSLIVWILLMYQQAFYPYIVSPDGYMQVQDIKNNVFTNWHPYVHTLFMKFFVYTFGSLNFFIYFRIISFAFIITKILFYFYDRGLSLVKVYIIALSITILPVTGILIVTIYKDIDFTLCLLLLTFLIYLMTVDFNYFNKYKINYLLLVASLLGVGLFRHNGIIVMILTIVFIFLISKQKKKIGISLITTFIIFMLFRYPMYNLLNVEDAPKNFNVATMLHGLNRLVYKENPKIDKNVPKYLDSIMPLEDWKYSYDPYNIDLMLHYQEVEIRRIKTNKPKLIKLYLKQGLKTPLELMKDRLYGIDSIWNVSEQDSLKTYKYQIIFDEFETDYGSMVGIEIKENKLSKVIEKSLLLISKNEILNIFFFRGGIYIDILVIIFVYIIMKDQKKILYCLFPFLINIITLFIAMHHYEYRYIWHIELITLLFILIFYYRNQNNKHNLIDK